MARYILHSPGLASYRRARLSSNVRHQQNGRSVRQQSQRLSAWIEQPRRQARERHHGATRWLAYAGRSRRNQCRTPARTGRREDRPHLESWSRRQREVAAVRKRPPPSSRENCRDGEPSRQIVSTSQKAAPRSRPGGPQCKARSAMQSCWRGPQTRSTATALAVALRGKQNPSHREVATRPQATHTDA